MRESWAGQSLKVGQPTGSWVPTGEPVLVKFSNQAASPFGWWSRQSSSARAAPAGSNGLPHSSLPPNASYDIRWL
ncbi:hypothetical protein [Nonomuraea dietziae]|uniref:hypothetical protein n=1 Tax=Nonomuraea dietziae TaxID=65515 RepID=UPI0031E1D4C5